MSNPPTPPWEPEALRQYERIAAPLLKRLAGEPIAGCEVGAFIATRWEVEGPAPTEKNPRAQTLRPVVELMVSVLRDGKVVAHATLPIGELTTTPTAMPG